MSARSFPPRRPHSVAPHYSAPTTARHSRSPRRSRRASRRRRRRKPAADGLETIIVTATRRELSVQDIPLNIAAFDDSLLEAREISDLAELGRNVPGPLRHRPRQALGEQHRRARLEPEPVPVGRVPRQHGRRHGRDLCRRDAVVRRFDVSTTSSESRCCSARRARCTAPARSAARSVTFRAGRSSTTSAVECARHHVLPQRERQHRLARRRDVQRTVRRQLRVPRFDRSLRRSRLHRHAVSRAASGRLGSRARIHDPAAVAANLYGETTSTGEETTSARVGVALATRRQRRRHLHLSLSEHGRRRPHAEPLPSPSAPGTTSRRRVIPSRTSGATSCCRRRSSPTSASPS